MSTPEPASTRDAAYTERLLTSVRRGSGIRRLTQLPYRRHIRSLRLGRVLDVGCGVGRNLVFLDGNGVGIDHNESSVAEARSRGITAYTSAEFFRSPSAAVGSFDSLLVAHVLEHMTPDEGRALLADHLRFVRRGGSVVAICPQQRGHASDPTHVTEFSASVLSALLQSLGLSVVSTYSYPLPAWAGGLFTHNETVARART